MNTKTTVRFFIEFRFETQPWFPLWKDITTRTAEECQALINEGIDRETYRVIKRTTTVTEEVVE